MKHIKFKAKDTYTPKWYYGALNPKDGEMDLTDFWGCWYNGDFDIDTLCRGTGKVDKNGKDIYGGDIAEYDMIDYCYTGKIVFDEKYLYWKFVFKRKTVNGFENGEQDFTETESNEYEVTGNIHESVDTDSQGE